MNIVEVHEQSAGSRDKYQQDASDGKYGRQQMDEFQGVGIFFVEVDAGNAAVEYLSPELAEVCPPFVPNPRFREQST